jgi:hypothetical protein
LISWIRLVSWGPTGLLILINYKSVSIYIYSTSAIFLNYMFVKENESCACKFSWFHVKFYRKRCKKFENVFLTFFKKDLIYNFFVFFNIKLLWVIICWCTCAPDFIFGIF